MVCDTKCHMIDKYPKSGPIWRNLAPYSNSGPIPEELWPRTRNLAPYPTTSQINKHPLWSVFMTLLISSACFLAYVSRILQVISDVPRVFPCVLTADADKFLTLRRFIPSVITIPTLALREPLLLVISSV